ncbi:glycosyltransferase [Paenibacillus nicotianae]|uniref:Glycosyltransferase n=1 Tax=Paenibacillus nicotianae TaxID=1526551 RepID=A0ABW4V147_9BACL
MLWILQIITFWLLIQLVFTIWNLSRMPRLGTLLSSKSSYYQPPASTDRSLTDTYSSTILHAKPLLSIMIPARNEEINIRECLLSVLNCRTDSIEIEVLVINDHSEDRTVAEIEKVMQQDQRVRLFHSNPLPEGWMGKSYACHQLVQHAQGDWWLFIDADVRLEVEGLEAAMVTAQSQGKGLISGFPRMETGTWLERIVVPMMSFVIAYHLPIMMVRRSRSPLFLAVTGAWLMIHPDSYARSGGHEGISNQIVEDMELARAVKRIGDPVTLANVQHYTSARMYRNAAQVWEGYKKNIFVGAGRSAWLAVGISIYYGLLFILPVFTLLYSLVAVDTMLIGWSLLSILLGMITKSIIDFYHGKPFWMGIYMPVSAACLIGIMLDSWRAGVNGTGYNWKGRNYG